MEKNQSHFSVGCCVHKKNCPFDEIISFRQLKLPQRNSLNVKKVQFWKYYGNFSIKRAWKIIIIIITIIIIIKIRRNIIIFLNNLTVSHFKWILGFFFLIIHNSHKENWFFCRKLMFYCIKKKGIQKNQLVFYKIKLLKFVSNKIYSNIFNESFIVVLCAFWLFLCFFAD